VLVDLQGTEDPHRKFQDGQITPARAGEFVLDADRRAGRLEASVGLDYKTLPQDVHKGDTLPLDDGRIVSRRARRARLAHPHRRRAGRQSLSNNKGINRNGGGLTAPALTEKDMRDIKTAAELKADFLGVSFPRSGADIRWARDLMIKAAGNSLIVAKIERAEAITALEEILDASDAIMVARGDLAVEVGDAVVPALQKRMIRPRTRKKPRGDHRHQMMESMISNRFPTRAEVSDVANAVLDGTDAGHAVRRNGTGSVPVETVAAMARVCVEAEKEDLCRSSAGAMRRPQTSKRAIAARPIFTANQPQHQGDRGDDAKRQDRAPHVAPADQVPIYAMSALPRRAAR
jgi:pyruvate kinase